MEEQKVGRPLMSEEEFKDTLDKHKEQIIKDAENGKLFLRNYAGVNKFKSVKRAIRRGHMSIFGDIYPNRPFNNRATKFNEQRKRIYEYLKSKQIAGL